MEVLEYVTEDGRVPFRDWLATIRDDQAAARIEVRVNRLRLGNFGDHKGVGQGVSELRLEFGPGYRIYFGRRGNSVVILLCGGDKASQSRDIALAQRYWYEYQRRRE